MNEPSITAMEIFAKRFRSGTKSSEEYKEGCLYGIRRKLEEIEKEECPYEIGTCQADAWFAGNCNGRHVAKSYLDDREVEER